MLKAVRGPARTLEPSTWLQWTGNSTTCKDWRSATRSNSTSKAQPFTAHRGTICSTAVLGAVRRDTLANDHIGPGGQPRLRLLEGVELDRHVGVDEADPRAAGCEQAGPQGCSLAGVALVLQQADRRGAVASGEAAHRRLRR
jgi:hypothetical protein